MSKQRSPFEALTSRERQERWLEFQSIRLPYVSASLDAEEPAEPEHQEQPRPAHAQPAPVRSQPPERRTRTDTPDLHAPSPREQVAQRERAAFQQARHKQYDAVIKRMVEASRQAQSYRDAAPRA